jgi:hypothetical protein
LSKLNQDLEGILDVDTCANQVEKLAH